MRIARMLVAASAVLLCSTVLAEPVVVGSSVPYAEDADVQRRIREECVDLNTQFAQFIREFAAEKRIEVVSGDNRSGKGLELRVEITHAVSQGNAWMGHQKGSAARGALYRDGERIASVKARRYSMGGAFAGFKGSCSVLGRTVKAMGRDIGYWLENPVDGAELGDY